MNLTIVMPAYNEEGCIEGVVRVWCNLLNQAEFQSGKLIVVNDGSRDRTGEILDNVASQLPNLVVIHQANGGHGKALRAAYDKALQLNAEYVFHVDSDDQFVVSDFSRLWSERSNSKFILGYREVRHDAFHRLVITRILKLINLFFFGAWIPDANIPFRLINGTYLKKLLQQIPSDVFAPNIFLSVLASCDGQKLFHVPITHKDRQTGAVSIVKWRLIKACLRSVKELIIFRVNLKRSLKALSSGVNN